MALLGTLLLVLLLINAGVHLVETLTTFNLTPMTMRECNARPTNPCGPLTLKKSDCYAYQKPGRTAMHSGVAVPVAVSSQDDVTLGAVQRHVRLVCTASEVSATKEDFVKQVKAIRK
ncbi:uncharacterized protein LOC129596967 [Paramacrobiotus metropolitanus]|uniref:uncharacterized protein LOC129596967 n=1 Tax=Paramacrobiotus metropolitanus TaxID=2943436 RepID=UPI0024465BEB|nr:uncharacterized protein LOC129596967 [Paramacrobiotus metropolitanus]